MRQIEDGLNSISVNTEHPESSSWALSNFIRPDLKDYHFKKEAPMMTPTYVDTNLEMNKGKRNIRNHLSNEEMRTEAFFHILSNEFDDELERALVRQGSCFEHQTLCHRLSHAPGEANARAPARTGKSLLHKRFVRRTLTALQCMSFAVEPPPSHHADPVSPCPLSLCAHRAGCASRLLQPCAAVEIPAGDV
jgi:hypothetical protein